VIFSSRGRDAVLAELRTRGLERDGVGIVTERREERKK
jgi:hypothetical protein